MARLVRLGSRNGVSNLSFYSFNLEEYRIYGKKNIKTAVSFYPSVRLEVGNLRLKTAT